MSVPPSHPLPPPLAVPPTPSKTAPADHPPQTPSVAVKTDHAVISTAGHAALAEEHGKTGAGATAAKTLTSDQALLIGKQMLDTNAANFKKIDTNGDGKLSLEEARAAGIKA